MKLCFSARGLSISCGGVRQFIQSLIPALVQTRGDDELIIAYNRQDQMGLVSNCREIYLPGSNRMWWDFVTLPRTLDKLNVDAAIFPKNVVPLGGRYAKYVIVHDLAYFVKGLNAYPWLDTLYMRTFIPPSMGRARRIFAVSEHTKQDIMKYVPCEPDKITVTYAAADSKYQPLEDPSAFQRVREKYGLPGTFMTYAGSLCPRKNMVRLLEAFARVKDRVPHHLVLTGSKSWNDDNVYHVMARLGLKDLICQVGYIDEKDMPVLYNMSDLLVYPSLYEGFGLPVLEAMQCGCPVLASNATSIPEVAGNAAILVDPMDVQGMAEAICEVLLNPNRREQLQQQGLEHARQFTWIRCAQMIWDRIRQDLMG